jgi:hypothetical protein
MRRLPGSPASALTSAAGARARLHADLTQEGLAGHLGYEWRVIVRLELGITAPRVTVFSLPGGGRSSMPRACWAS